jgi:hypothetical protein
MMQALDALLELGQHALVYGECGLAHLARVHPRHGPAHLVIHPCHGLLYPLAKLLLLHDEHVHSLLEQIALVEGASTKLSTFLERLFEVCLVPSSIWSTLFTNVACSPGSAIASAAPMLWCDCAC